MSGLAPHALVLLTLLAGCHDDRRGVSIDDHERSWTRWRDEAEKLSKRAAELEQLRQLLYWYSLTRNELGRLEVLHGGLEALVTRERLLGLHRYENSPQPEGIARRRLRYLRHHLARLFVDRRGGRLGDAYVSAMLEGVEVGEQRVRVADVPAIIAWTRERSERIRLQRGRSAWLKRMERLLRRRYELARLEAKRLGLSLFELMERGAEQETRQQLHQATALARRTRSLLARSWGTLATSLTNGRGQALNMSDLYYLRAGANLQGRMVESQLLPSLELLQKGLGLARGQLAAAAEGIATTCVPVSPPADVRVAYQSSHGLWSHVRLFEAAGQAICRAQGRDLPWEFRAAGPQLAAQTMGHLAGLVWLEPGWWKAYSEQQPAAARLSADQISDLIRIRIVLELIRIRIDGIVAPAVRVALEGGPPSAYAKAWSGEGVGSPAALYARLMQRQLKLKLLPHENLTYVQELDTFNEMRGPARPFDVRAYVLAHMLLEHLRKRFGPAWFNDDAAGPYLVQRLCVKGSAATAGAIARSFKLKKGLDLNAPVRVLDEAWRWLHSGPAQEPDGAAQGPDGPAQKPDGPAQKPDGPAQEPDGP
jgi:hypothetical protein